MEAQREEKGYLDLLPYLAAGMHPRFHPAHPNIKMDVSPNLLA